MPLRLDNARRCPHAHSNRNRSRRSSSRDSRLTTRLAKCQRSYRQNASSPGEIKSERWATSSRNLRATSYRYTRATSSESAFLAHGRTYPTAASYRYAVEKGADHPCAVETLAALRAPGFTMPPFSRPVPKRYEWDAPENTEHTAELRADIEVISRLWRNRQSVKREQPWPTEYPPIPRALWKRLFRLRNRYHSLSDTLEFEGLQRYAEPPTRTCPNTETLLT